MAAEDSIVEVAGTGEPIVLVHGLGGTGNVFTPQVGVLSKYFTTIRPDLAGSGRAPLRDGISVASHVDDLLALLKKMDLASAHFVGHSYGSVVCQHLAAREPKRVKSLALLGPIRAPADPMRQALRDRGAKARAEGMVAIADITVQVGTSAATKAHRPEVAAFVRELVMRQSPEGYARICDAIAAIEAADLSAVRCPALVITGDEDATSPPAVARAVAAALVGSRFIVLGRCGHWTPLERAAEVTEALCNFYFAQA